MKKVILNIDGMSCSACQNRVEKYLNNQAGVKASVNLVMANALIEYDEKKLTLDDLDRFIEEAGYKSLGIYNENNSKKKDNTKVLLIIYTVLIGFLMYISMGQMLHFKINSALDMLNYPINYGISLLILTIPFLIFAYDILKNGIKNIIYKNPNMNSLVTIGVISSFVYSIVNLVLIIKGNKSLVHNLYFDSTAMIIYFVKIGRYIDKESKEKTKEAIKQLVQITPQNALLKTIDGEKKVTIDEVKKGDILICKPGMKIAVDGVILYGNTHIDEAFITGESRQEKKKINDKVIAGSINMDGYIEYKAERIGKDSTISQIVRHVLESANTKAPIQRITDKISGYFASEIIIIAFLTLIVYLILGKSVNESIISFVTILLVACPCALGLATPLAIVVSIGNCASNGILIKSSEVLENIRLVDTVIFDKTGTLTYGKLRISKINNYSNYSDKELIRLVASLEKKSIHPIALAFNSYVEEKKLKIFELSDFKENKSVGLEGVIKNKKIVIGNKKILKGLNIKKIYKDEEKKLSQEGNSIVYVIEDNNLIGIIGVKDIVRNNSKEVVKKLKKMGKKVFMLSGDNETISKSIASSLNIDDVVAECMPEDKEKYLKKLKNDGHIVMMVGDGINDALALTSSDVGVSVNGATDIAADSSDVIFMTDDISKVIDLINNSNKTVKIIKQNLFWSFIYNICMLPIAIGILKPFGIALSPILASATMTISSLTVILNSLRLKGGNL